jgi:hypothetical protein
MCVLLFFFFYILFIKGFPRKIGIQAAKVFIEAVHLYLPNHESSNVIIDEIKTVFK